LAGEGLRLVLVLRLPLPTRRRWWSGLRV
jgi:hypothetical protein